MASRPYIVVIGGPNGAGKTTIARAVVEQTFGVSEFVNADTIAAGLSAFSPESVAFTAGRVMLTRLKELAAAGETFSFESTLASRTFAPWLREQRARGCDVHLVYIALRSPRLAMARVRADQDGRPRRCTRDRAAPIPSLDQQLVLALSAARFKLADLR